MLRCSVSFVLPNVCLAFDWFELKFCVLLLNSLLVRPVKKGQSLTWDDVAMDTTTRAWQLRQELETAFR